MNMLQNIARNGCRGSVLQILNNKPKVLLSGGVSNFVNLRINTKPVIKYGPLFSTSHSILAGQSDHSHSRIWTAEKFLSAGLLGLLPLTIAFPNQVFDYALALALTTHVHWGLEAVAVDYVRKDVVGATLARAAVAGVYALSVFTLCGLFYFNYSDVGMGQAIRMLWKL